MGLLFHHLDDTTRPFMRDEIEAPRGGFVRPPARVGLCQLQQIAPLHLMPRANNDPKSISPAGLRRSYRQIPIRDACWH